MRTGLIDIGTNTVMLLIVDAELRPVVDVCRFARLGQGLAASGRLADEAIARALDVCREYRRLLDEHAVTEVFAVGTQALREAANRDAFLAPARDILRAQIDVIDGEAEAELALLSVQRTFPELTGAFVVVDVGGGSTEIVVGDGGRGSRPASLPIGAVRLTEQHLRHDPPAADEVRALFTAIDAQLAPLDLPRGAPIVATAGTATTLATLALRMDVYDAARVTGARITTLAVEAQLARLLSTPLAARRALRGMEPGRADVIAAGVAILARLLARLDARELVVADRGVRWGLAFKHAARGGGAR